MQRRDFLKTTAATGLLWLADWEKAFSAGTKASLVGKPWQGWKRGQFQVHFIYTGVAESMFYIFPDGTTMLLDCGDHNAAGRGKLAVPILPSQERHSGEWIARYVSRVNPHGNLVDYMMCSHYHSDHVGTKDFNAGKLIHDGKEYVLSGFAQAGETLHFAHAIDRSWPSYDVPLPIPDDYDGHVVGLLKDFYAYHQKNHGLQIERFRVGETDQIRQLHKPNAYQGFHIRNICGCGKIARPDGTILDLYDKRIKEEGLTAVNENGMSLGMLITYGDFKFYTAGDFSDGWKLPDGSQFEIEDALADVVEHVNVAKINHHGHYSMPARLVKSLSAQAWISCVWDQLHNVSPVMDRLTDRSLYPGERIVCPGILPAERRAEDAGKAWLNDVESAAFEGGHIVLNVEKGGKNFQITYLSANDESMTVKSVINFHA